MDYTPIARALHKLDAATETMMIALFIAKENLNFLKMRQLCDLVERQGIDIGQNYKNYKVCPMFVHYVAQDLKLQLLDRLSKVKCFIIQSDGSTDSEKNE